LLESLRRNAVGNAGIDSVGHRRIDNVLGVDNLGIVRPENLDSVNNSRNVLLPLAVAFLVYWLGTLTSIPKATSRYVAVQPVKAKTT
jgi:hypothetical protein